MLRAVNVIVALLITGSMNAMAAHRATATRATLAPVPAAIRRRVSVSVCPVLSETVARHAPIVGYSLKTVAWNATIATMLCSM